jgi:YfiH family protein
MTETITPVVASGFVWKDTAAGHALISTDLDQFSAHLFTTRALQFRGGLIDDDYDRLGDALGVSASDVVRVRQVHGRVVRLVRPGDDLTGVPVADALVSTDPARAIAVRIADCVPVLLADRRSRMVAAIHAGWRGTAAGVCQAVIDVVRSLGVDPADVIAAVGPSIGPCCYQVDAAVRRAFDASHHDAAAWFADDGPGRWRLNLWQATVDQLTRAGVRAANVHVVRLCTAEHLDVCYSHRKEGPSTGRLVAAIRFTDASRSQRVRI